MSGALLDSGQHNYNKFPSVTDFESANFDPDAFGHEAHVYIAWSLLQQDTFSVATHRFTTGSSQDNPQIWYRR